MKKSFNKKGISLKHETFDESMFGAVRIETFLIVNCLWIGIFCVESYQLWQSHQEKYQKHLIMHRCIILLCCLLAFPMSVCGYRDIIDQVDEMRFEMVSKFFHLFQLCILGLIFYSYWHFGEIIATTYYRIVHQNNNILPKKWNQCWKSTTIAILCLYTILLVIYFVVMEKLVLLWSFFLLFDVFLCISQIICFQMMKTLGRPISIYLTTITKQLEEQEKQQQLQQKEQKEKLKLDQSHLKKIETQQSSAVENININPPSNMITDQSQKMRLKSIGTPPRKVNGGIENIMRPVTSSGQVGRNVVFQPVNLNVRNKTNVVPSVSGSPVGPRNTSGTINLELPALEQIGSNSLAMEEEEDKSTQIVYNHDHDSLKHKLKAIDWNKVKSMKRELKQFNLISIVNLLTICIAIWNIIDLLSFKIFDLINSTILISDVTYLTQFEIIFCILIECIIYLWYYNDNTGISTSFHLSTLFAVANKNLNKTNTMDINTDTQQKQREEEQQQEQQQGQHGEASTKEIKFSSGDMEEAIVDTKHEKYGVCRFDTWAQSRTDSVTGTDSAGISNKSKQIVIEKARGKYNRKKVPRTNFTSESKQAVLDYYFEHSSLRNAKPYEIDLKKQLSRASFNNNVKGKQGSGTITLFSGIVSDDEKYQHYHDGSSILTNTLSNTLSNETVIRMHSEYSNNENEDRKISMMIYEFDNVLATLSNKIDSIQHEIEELEKFEQFKSSNPDTMFERLRYYDTNKLELLLGGHERIESLRQHLNRVVQHTSDECQLFVFCNNRPTMFVVVILDLIGLLKPWFVSLIDIGHGMKLPVPHVFGNNHAQMISHEYKSHLLLFRLMHILEKNHDSVLYVGNDKRSVENLRHINACHVYHIKTNGMLTKQMDAIEKLIKLN